MISPKDLSTLKSASEVLTVAKTANEEQVESAVARAINYAANTSTDGKVIVEWNQPLPDALITKLTANGYLVKNKKDAYSRDIKNMYIITAVGGGK